jgi:DNA-binding MarR family transcriptional regulator
VRLRLLNRVVTNLYDDALRPLGLKISQLNILTVTAKLGLARPTQICEILQLDKSTLSRNVERMREHGWLDVVPEEDARAQPFRLTLQGKRLIEKAVPAWEQAQRQATELLGDGRHTISPSKVGRSSRVPLITVGDPRVCANRRFKPVNGRSGGSGKSSVSVFAE